MKDSKKTKLTIGSIVKKMDRHIISFNHPLQRESEQWSSVMKGNLISDILQENPIPDLVFAEQIIHDAPVTWGIDGKQRCTNIQQFINNVYSISKKVDRYMIEYPVAVLDEDGLPMRDEDGIVIHKTEVCDIRGKKYKALPKELQERILDYGIDIVLYYDCSEENLAYHIKRYNEGRAMNPEQKGLTRIGTHFASVVKNISAMSFFEDAIGNYTNSQFKNGKVYRVIVESIMTTRFIEAWTKDYANICDYIKENATNEDFEVFRGLVERLEDNIDETVGKMFDAKNSFLWFGLYSRFVKLGLEDDKFNTFMLKLNNGLHQKDENGKVIKDAPMTGLCVKEIDGTTLESLLKDSSTKDVSIVKTRIDFLTKLMCNYFGVDVPVEEDRTDKLNEELADFAQNFVSDDVAIQTLILTTNNHFTNFETKTIKEAIRYFKTIEIQKDLEDIMEYKSFIDDRGFADTDVNIPFYIYAVKYIFNNNINIDIDGWLEEFKETAFVGIECKNDIDLISNSTIVAKQNEIIHSINKFNEKENMTNEVI
jgi:hypothetical protein